MANWKFPEDQVNFVGGRMKTYPATQVAKELGIDPKRLRRELRSYRGPLDIRGDIMTPGMFIMGDMFSPHAWTEYKPWEVSEDVRESLRKRFLK